MNPAQWMQDLRNAQAGYEAIARKPGTPAEMDRWLSDARLLLRQAWDAIENFGDAVAADPNPRDVAHLGDLTDAYNACERAYDRAVTASFRCNA